MSYHKSTDGNQAEIMAALRRAGWTVADTHSLGRGFPDLVIGKNDRNLLVETKMPGKKQTPEELQFSINWRGQYLTVYDAEEAVNLAEQELAR